MRTEERVVSFGPFDFNFDSLELRKSGHRRALQQQPARMLAILLGRAGETVSREELQRHLWPDGTYVDFDTGINAIVRKVRAALGESRERPRHIHTSARRGYRFEFAGEDVGVRRPLTTVAVMPFGSAHPEDEYLSDGITEMLIQSISMLPGVRKVIARNSVYHYRNEDPLETGRRFNVQAVVAGTVAFAGETLMAAVELLSTADGHRIWGARYERPASEMPELVDEICARIGERVSERKRPARAKAPQFAAYQLYLQGRYAWNKRPAVGAVDKAIALFEESIRRDPRSPLASVGLADSYNTLAAWESGSVAPQVGFEAAKKAARRALELDERNAEAHASLAYAHLHYDWDFAAAEREFKRSVRLNANYSHAHHWYSHLLIAAGRTHEALEESRRSLELDPLDLIINVHLAWHYYMAGQPEDALRESRRVIDMERSFHWAYFFAGLALLAMGDAANAVAELEQAVNLSGGSTVMLSALGHARAAARDRDGAVKILEDLGELSRSRYVSSYEISLIHAELEETDLALTWLDRAFDERSGWLPYAAVEPRLASLRHHPRFAVLLNRMGLALTSQKLE